VESYIVYHVNLSVIGRVNLSITCYVKLPINCPVTRNRIISIVLVNNYDFAEMTADHHAIATPAVSLFIEFRNVARRTPSE
jgi:hypothetical protein